MLLEPPERVVDDLGVGGRVLRVLGPGGVELGATCQLRGEAGRRLVSVCARR